MIRRMRRTTRHRLVTLAAILAIGGASAGTLLALDATSGQAQPEPLARIDATPADGDDGVGEPAGDDASAPDQPKREDPRDALALDPSKFELVDDHYVQRLEDGRVAHLTLVPRVQSKVRRLIRLRKPPHAGFAAIEPSTGRVLGLVSRSYANEPIENYALRAGAPSASVFKLVTAAALLELSNIDPDKPVCYSGGVSNLTEDQIRGNAVTDNRCADLGDSVAGSLNVVIARLAYYNLARRDLEEMAQRFGFNREIPFELPVEVSNADFSDDDIERARTAAGFWNVNLSALHGALIAAAIANHGVMMRPTLVDWIEGPNGKVVYRSEPEPWLTTMSPAKADLLQKMAIDTTVTGTASRVFQSKHFPDDIAVSGKTGTLSNKRPYLLFTWFVGSAPAEDPDIAVGAIVANPRKWWIKGMHLAGTAIEAYDDLLEDERQSREEQSED